MAPSDNGVSPVIAVVLLVAITVVLSAAVGLLTGDVAESMSKSGTSTIGVRTSTTGSNVTFQVVTGTADRLKLLVNGSEVANKSDVEPGDLVSASVSPKSDVTVVSVTDGESKVVLSENPLSKSAVSTSNGLVTDGLIGYYKFENGSGLTAYDSVSSYDGDITGADWHSSAKVGEYALSFPGSSDRVNLGDVSEYDSPPFTVSAWFKAPSPSDSTWEVIFGKVYWNNNAGYAFFVNPKGNLTYGAPNSAYVHAPSVSSSTWHHGVLVVNSSAVTIYLDGQRISSGGTPPNPTAEPAYIGVRSTNDGTSIKDPWEGEIDDVRVYNRTLNDSEVSELYNGST